MWEYMHVPKEPGGPAERERMIGRLAAEKMREYDGTVFMCIARRDRERRLTLRRAAEASGLRPRDARILSAAFSAGELAKEPHRLALFAEPPMRQYFSDYLDACPSGARHLLLYFRRLGNGPSPQMSAFMDLLLERGVDIWDFRDIDGETET